MPYTASAPGSLMLLGEYAVLDGGWAVVSSINRFIHVAIELTDDNKFHINSKLGTGSFTAMQLQQDKRWHYINLALSIFPDITGCSISITSEFAPTLGLGSSAAVVIAIIKALTPQATPAKLLQLGIKAFQHNQQRGSGADLAASAFAGTIAYNTQQQVELLPTPGKLTAIYSGHKTITQSAIKIVEQNLTANKRQQIFAEIARIANDGRMALQANDINSFATCMQQQQAQMQYLGVNTPALQLALDYMQHNDNILAAKISGSGLGDCAVGISTTKVLLTSLPAPLQWLDVEFGERNEFA